MAVSAPAADRIGEQLVRENLISRDQLTRALEDARANNSRVGFSLVKLGFLNEQDLVRALARQHRVPAGGPGAREAGPPNPAADPHRNRSEAPRAPLAAVGRTLTVAMSNPTDLGVIDDLKFITRLDIEPVIAGDFTLKKTIDREYEQSDERITDLLKQIELDDIEVMADAEEEMSAVALAAAVDEARWCS
jgi:type IV pilus assembly protein PilB